MNILFTCAGRRNYLINYFKVALQGVGGNVIAVDSDLYAPALSDVEIKHQVPDVYHGDYINSLLDICDSENVDMLISLNDLELPVLADHREKFTKRSVMLLISDSQVIDRCLDKMETYRFLKQSGIDTPATFSDLEQVKKKLASTEIDFPFMVKPRWGSASIGLAPVYEMEELERAYSTTHNIVKNSHIHKLCDPEEEKLVIIQDFIKGQEYGLDVLNDFDGNLVSVYAKKKMGMRAGETDKAFLVDDSRLLAVGEKLGKSLKHIGNLDADVFVEDDRITVLELNPRFGGGYPFSHELGARYPDAIVAWASNNQFDPATQEKIYDTVVAKCDRLISCALN